jgi:hypothetical protein
MRVVKLPSRRATVRWQVQCDECEANAKHVLAVHVSTAATRRLSWRQLEPSAQRRQREDAAHDCSCGLFGLQRGHQRTSSGTARATHTQRGRLTAMPSAYATKQWNSLVLSTVWTLGSRTVAVHHGDVVSAKCSSRWPTTTCTDSSAAVPTVAVTLGRPSHDPRCEVDSHELQSVVNTPHTRPQRRVCNQLRELRLRRGVSGEHQLQRRVVALHTPLRRIVQHERQRRRDRRQPRRICHPRARGATFASAEAAKGL